MPVEFIKNIFLFIYIAAVVSFVWVSLNNEGLKNILREGTKTFLIFSLCAFVLAVIIHVLS